MYGIAFVHNPYGSIRVGVPQLPKDHRDVIEAIAKHNRVQIAMGKLVQVKDTYQVPDTMLQTIRISLLRRYDLERMGIMNWNASANEEMGHIIDHSQANTQRVALKDNMGDSKSIILEKQNGNEKTDDPTIIDDQTLKSSPLSKVDVKFDYECL